MSEQPKIDDKTAPVEKKAEEKVTPTVKKVEDKSDKKAAETYQAKYVRISKVKELFKDGEGDTAVNIRISGEAKAKVAEFLDAEVKKAVKELIARLPRKSKGDKKGELSRITISLEEFAEK